MLFGLCFLFLRGGRKKFINRGAFVGWHGDADQKDFREFVSGFRRLQIREADGDRLTDEEKLYLDENRVKFVALTELQREQSDLFRSVGVSPLVGRFGQEPINYPSDGWTFTVRAMEKLGIKNVSAEDSYGQLRYFQHLAPQAAMVNGGPLLVFDVMEGGAILPLE